MGIGDEHIESVSEMLLARKIVAVPATETTSILREAGVPARKCLLLQARFAGTSMTSPPTALLLPAAVPVALPVPHSSKRVAVCVLFRSASLCSVLHRGYLLSYTHVLADRAG